MLKTLVVFFLDFAWQNYARSKLLSMSLRGSSRNRGDKISRAAQENCCLIIFAGVPQSDFAVFKTRTMMESEKVTPFG